MKTRHILINLCSALVSYGGLLLFNIITSRIQLLSYGSENNGLLSSVNQIFSYIALLEAGIGTATVRALYHPIVQANDAGVADVLAASKAYYRRSAWWYFLCVLVAAFVWPLVLDTTISYWTIWGVIFFQGVAGVLTFLYCDSITSYLTAAGKNYVNNHVHVIVTLLTYSMKLVICLTGWDLVCISLSHVVVNLIKCGMYHGYMRRICPQYFVRKKVNLSLLKQRGAFLAHEISGVVFFSTDAILLSAFCGLQETSVYAVYSMVVSALRNVIGQMFNGTKYMLGRVYSQDLEQYKKTHDLYNAVYICCVFAVYTVAYLLFLPFVALYTDGVSDAQYLDSRLPMLFVVQELLSCCRNVDSEVIRISLHAKQTTGRAVLEATINLVASMILVQKLGIYGVLAGTILALLYRSNDIILYVNHRILNRSAKREYGVYGINCLTFFVIAMAGNAVPIQASNYLVLLGWAIGVTAGVLCAYLLVNLASNRQLRDLAKRVWCRFFPRHRKDL